MPDSGLSADTALNTAKSLLPAALGSVAQTGDTQYRSVPWTLKQNSKDRDQAGPVYKEWSKERCFAVTQYLGKPEENNR